jgi:ABC-type uncharacterized transport system involved in gliding motility auxiliary subunit
MQGSLKKITGATGLLVLLALLVIVNVLAGQLRLRVDTTAEKLYTLSDGTRAVLKALPRAVTLKFYRSVGAEGLPPAFQQYAQRIDDLLQEYASASGGRVSVELLDPQPDSDQEEWAQRYGIVGQRVDALDDGAALYLGLAALSGAKQSSIPFFSPADEPQLEYLVTRLLTDVTAANKPKIGVISTLPVLGMQGSFMSGGGGAPPWAFISELRNQYQVEQLPPVFTEIPPDVDTVLLVHPKRISETALFALDQFVLRGGTLLAFTDPLCLSEQDFDRGMPGFMDKASDLNRLTETWGIKMDPTLVVSDAAAATRVRMPDGSAENSAVWLTVRRAQFNQQEIATAPLESVMLPMAGFFSGTPAEGLTLTPLITASPAGGSMTGIEASMGAMAGKTSFTKFEQPAPIALRLTGRFKTSFPNGRPEDPAQPGGQPGGTSATPALQESARDGIVVLVADTDLLYDDFAVQRLNLPGRSAYVMANDNINLTANLIGQLTGGDQLISLRSRGTFDRPFTRVLALQQKAQERWRMEELKLQDQLRTTQMRLGELETAKDPTQQFVVTPEQKKEIAQFREQASETRRQLKTVRKNLRQEMEQLGLWIKTLNLATLPGAVVLFGLVHGLRRRQGSRG